MPQGTLFTQSTARQALEASNRDYYGRQTWANAYGALSMQEDKALSQLNTQYGQQLNDAYISAQQQAAAVQASNLGQGFKNLALAENQTALNQAFESYRQSFLQGKSEIESGIASQRQQVTSLLNTEATNLADYGNAHVDYLENLYKNDPTAFANDVNLSRYLVTEGEGENATTRLMNRGELTGLMFDEDGNLTDTGKGFLSLTENYAVSNPDVMSFGDYLYDTNRNLFNWASSQSEFDFGRTGNTQFKELSGVTENKYVAKDNFTDEQWTKATESFVKANDDLMNLYESGVASERDLKAFNDEAAKKLPELDNLIKQLNLSDDEEITNLYKYLNDSIETAKTAGPGKGNNRGNRKLAGWHVMNAYQQLYNAIANRMGKSGVSRVVT